MAENRRLTPQAKASMLEVMVDASLQGHDLGPFEPVDVITGGFQAVCRRCARSVWVGENGLMYSLLEENCSKSAGMRGK